MGEGLERLDVVVKRCFGPMSCEDSLSRRPPLAQQLRVAACSFEAELDATDAGEQARH